MKVLHCDYPGTATGDLMHRLLDRCIPGVAVENACIGEDIIEKVEHVDLIILYLANNVRYRMPPYPTRDSLENLATLVCTIKERCDAPVWLIFPSLSNINPFADQVLRNLADWQSTAPFKIADFEEAVKQFLETRV